MTRPAPTHADALALLADARAALALARRGERAIREPEETPVAVRACALCGRAVLRDDWAVTGARGAWHAECWHIEHHGDLLDLLTVERAS